MESTPFAYVVAGAMMSVGPAVLAQDDSADQSGVTRLVDSESITGIVLWDYNGNEIGILGREWTSMKTGLVWLSAVSLAGLVVKIWHDKRRHARTDGA